MKNVTNSHFFEICVICLVLSTAMMLLFRLEDVTFHIHPPGLTGLQNESVYICLSKNLLKQYNLPTVIKCETSPNLSQELSVLI